MSTTRRRLGIAGTLVGVGAASVGAAVAAKRYAVGRARLRPDPEAGEPFGEIRGQSSWVNSADGVELYVEIDGPPARAHAQDAPRSVDPPPVPRPPGPAQTERSAGAPLPASAVPMTIVFCHGYTLNQDSWHYQRRDLREALGGTARLVFWDQRGHGRSQRGDLAGVSIEQLGADLYAVLREIVPPGHPVVLVGHSMGGMTIMALADRHPELFGSQVVGVGLISTSTGGLTKTTLGLPSVLGTVFRTTAPGVVRTLGRRPKLVERARRLSGDVTFLATRRFGFVDPEVSPAVVDFLDRMVQGTPFDVIADFYGALMVHDKRAALAALNAVPTLVLTGDHDRLTPISHAREIATAVSSAELVEAPDCGHLPILEYPELVHAELLRLLDRAGLSAVRERTA